MRGHVVAQPLGHIERAATTGLKPAVEPAIPHGATGDRRWRYSVRLRMCLKACEKGFPGHASL